MTLTTTPPPKDVVLYDGHCRICTAAVKPLGRWVRPSQTELVSFREPGVLDRFPGLGAKQCEQALQLVRTDGRIFSGAEAGVQSLRHRLLGQLARVYYLPGLKQLTDAAYAQIARRRFELGGRTEGCDPDGTCHLHLKARGGPETPSAPR